MWLYRKGFFKDEGLDVELTTTPGGDKTMTALLSNAIDVALVGSETSIYVSQQGSDDPVINFAQLTQTDGTFLVARKKVDKFDWNSLKGKVFLGQRKGGMPQMAGEFTLKKHNIDPQKDLQLIQNIEFANIVSAYASGTGEYVQLFEPQASIIEKEGKGYRAGFLRCGERTSALYRIHGEAKLHESKRRHDSEVHECDTTRAALGCSEKCG